MALEVAILGPLELRRDGRALRLTGARQRALVAALALEAPAVVSADRLIDVLWGDDPPGEPLARLQWQVASVRRLAGADAIVTRAPGYAFGGGRDAVDAHRFERLLDDAHGVIASDPHRARRLLGDALRLWRGTPLADVPEGGRVEGERRRLEERRLAALEELVAVAIATGDHARAAAEAEGLLVEHPYREALHALRMRALYAAGRQADALTAFQEARTALDEELGVEPTPELRALHRTILNQEDVGAVSSDAAPRRAEPSPAGPRRPTIVVAPADDAELAPLLAAAAPLASSSAPHDLVLVRLLPPTIGAGLAEATARLAAARTALAGGGVAARVAAFTTEDWPGDLLRLLEEPTVDLALLSAPAAMAAGRPPPPDLARVLAEAPCDVALAIAGARCETEPSADVVVLFGGGAHDWAALELAAWIASAEGRRLVLAGTAADEAAGRRDASRLLAVASLAVQELVGVVAEPRLVAPAVDAVVEAVAGGRLLLLPVSERWAAEGVGRFRAEVVRASEVPALLVRSGPRPGGLTPPEGLTRYSWTRSGP